MPAPARARPASSRTFAALAAALALATMALYLKTAGFAFVFDDVYIFNDPQVKRGLSPGGIAWAFSSIFIANWIPVTAVSHLLDVSLFGLAPAGHHVVNALLHTANAVLVLAVLRMATGALWRSAAAAALFALHPLHVESVAWVAERKDVLSTLLGLLAVLAYLGYVRRPTARAYAAVFLLFSLALMSKPMLVTLPFVLLLLDGWPLGRLRRGALRRPLLEKVPLLAPAAAVGWVTVVVQAKWGAVVSSANYPLWFRAANALSSYGRYLLKTFWPADLSVFYPNDLQFFSAWRAAAGGAVLAAVTAAALLQLRRRPYLAVGWFWFLGTLVPVIGLVQVGGQALADRYTYLPLVGLFTAICWGAPPAPRPGTRLATAALAACVLAALWAASWRQLDYWRDQKSLFGHALLIDPGNFVAANWMGVITERGGDLKTAGTYYAMSLKANPYLAEARYNMARFLESEGRKDEALLDYRMAFMIKPESVEFRDGYAKALTGLGRGEEAAAVYRQALERAPNDPQALNSLGLLLAGMGRDAEAVDYFRRVRWGEAMRAASTLFSLGNALVRLGRLEEARQAFAEAVRLAPPYAEAWNNLGSTLANLSHPREAAAAYREALRLRPDYADARANLNRITGR